jgi:hypothetical protein
MLPQAAQISRAATYQTGPWQNAEYPVTEGKRACR